jgi:hypothetical protein
VIVWLRKRNTNKIADPLIGAALHQLNGGDEPKDEVLEQNMSGEDEQGPDDEEQATPQEGNDDPLPGENQIEEDTEKPGGDNPTDPDATLIDTGRRTSKKGTMMSETKQKIVRSKTVTGKAR